MRINVGSLKIECFESEQEYRDFLKDNNRDSNLIKSTLFHGKLYDIPSDLRLRFPNPNEAIVDIKKQNFNDTNYVLIHS